MADHWLIALKFLTFGSRDLAEIVAMSAQDSPAAIQTQGHPFMLVLGKHDE